MLNIYYESCALYRTILQSTLFCCFVEVGCFLSTLPNAQWFPSLPAQHNNVASWKLLELCKPSQ